MSGAMRTRQTLLLGECLAFLLEEQLLVGIVYGGELVARLL